LDRKRDWTAWSAASDREFARLHQPPFGDRAVLDTATGAFVGLVGLVATLEPFGRLPSFGGDLAAHRTLEMGLFWAISPHWQGVGRATEAAGALIDAAFGRLGVARVVATTEHDNHASIGVMRRLGMRVERNPIAEPFHFQTVGRLDAGARP
jgi:RimJ/RimL family protein N-acetyltransferase